MILVKDLKFHASLFLSRKHLGILLNNVLERKAAFLNYKRSFSVSSLKRYLQLFQGVFSGKTEMDESSNFLTKYTWLGDQKHPLQKWKFF